MRTNDSPLPAWVAPGLLLLVGILLRVPALALPLGADDAVLAGAAEDLAAGRLPDLEGRGPLLPVLLWLPTLLGVPAAVALRWLGLLLGALAPLLFHGCARGIGFSVRGAGFAALLLAVHPLLVAHVGGAEAGAQGLALTLLCLALRRLAWGSEGTQRAVLACAAGIALAHPGGWPYMLALLPAAWRGETTGKGRAFVLGVGALLLAFGLTQRHGPEGSLGGAAVLLLVLALVVLLPQLAWGLTVLLRGAQQARGALFALASASVAHLVLLALPWTRPGVVVSGDGLGAGVLLVPCAVLAVAVGAARLRAPWRVRLEGSALALGLVGSLLAGLGPTQSALLGEQAGLAGRLNDLGKAVKLAAHEAGPGGWVAVDLGEDTAAQGHALRGWIGDRHLLVAPASGGSTEAPAGWPQGGPRTLALVSVRPEPGAVGTLGGFGVFSQEHAGLSGAYHVLRVRRP